MLSAITAAAVAIAAAASAPAYTESAAGPARPEFKIVKRTKKSATLKIGKTRNATGYQIFMSNSHNGKFVQTAATRMRTVKLTKLKKNKAYYVKIRAYKTVGYRITLGRFSKTIKIDKFKKDVPSSPGGESPTPVPSPLPTLEPGQTAAPTLEPGQTAAPTPEPELNAPPA